MPAVGCGESLKSTSCAHLHIQGPHTRFPLAGLSERQGCLSHSTPEVEIVAADFAMTRLGLPAITLWQQLGGADPVAFDYVSHLKTLGAATAPASFLQAVNFMIKTIEPEGARSIISSYIIQGVADREFVAAMATSMVLLHASAFERRVVFPLQQWALLILRFAQRPAHLCVDARKSLAHTLLIAAPGDIDVNSRKFRDAFRHDLRHVQDHGMVPDRLSKFLNGLKSFYRADVRDCEKTNKVISLLLERCPRIGDDLLSSRVALKHYLGETGAGAGFQHKKWSDFRPVAEGLYDDNQTMIGVIRTGKSDHASSGTHGISIGWMHSIFQEGYVSLTRSPPRWLRIFIPSPSRTPFLVLMRVVPKKSWI